MHEDLPFTPANEQTNPQTSKMADAGLNFLLNDPEELLRFMNIAGYSADSLRGAISTQELELAILSYFANNEPALLAMCANSGVNASDFMRCLNLQVGQI